MSATREQPLSIIEFAEALRIHPQDARRMARSEVFQKHKISVNIACVGTLPYNRHGTGRRNKKWRIYMSRYEDARDRGLLAP